MNSIIVSNCVASFVVDLFTLKDENEDAMAKVDLQSRYGSNPIKILQSRRTADQAYSYIFLERVEEIYNTDRA